MDEQELQSLTIGVLRFPLLIMVIFIHMNPATVNLLDADFCLFSGHGIYNVTRILFSHVLPSIAVPCFYLISGLLFFLNFREWTWGGYKNKLKSRAKSLVIPYLLWNVLFYLFRCASLFVSQSPSVALQDIKRSSWHVLYDINVWGTDRIDWLGNHLMSSGPYDLPLWFLRDLIIVTLLTPIIFWCVKRLKRGFIAILFLAYVSRVWIQVPGFSITALFFYSLGAYFAINGLNVVTFAKRYKCIILSMTFLLLIAAVIFDGSYSVIGMNIMPFYVIAGVFSAFYIAAVLVKNLNLRPNKILVASCLFVYAMHGAPLPALGSVEGYLFSILQRLFGTSGFSDGISYLLCPFLTASTCVGLYWILQKFLPRTTSVFSGGRV